MLVLFFCAFIWAQPVSKFPCHYWYPDYERPIHGNLHAFSVKVHKQATTRGIEDSS